MTDDLGQRERAALATFAAVEPPDGVAREVAERAAPAATSPAPRPARRPRLRRLAAAGALAAAAVLVFWSSARSPDRRAGAVAGAAHRTSVEIGRRGVAVLDAGAEVSWTLAGADAHIRQRRGNVFYRVERDGPFVVDTAAGTVTVTGTCFRVEVDPMVTRDQLKAGAVGAAIGAVVLVTVYEGKIRLANGHGQLEVGAGERAIASAATSPTAVDTAQPKAGDPRMAAEARPRSFEQAVLQGELTRLRERNDELERKLATSPPAEPQERRPSFEVLNPSKEELLRRAKTCSVAYDRPWLGHGNEGPPIAQLQKDLDVSAEEAEIIRASRARMAQRMNDEIRRLFIETTGDTRLAQSLSIAAMKAEINAKAPEGEAQRVYQRLSAERAGLQPLPTSPAGQSAYERLTRLETGAGDEHERDLAAELGPARARELRAKKGGWEGGEGRMYRTPGCPRQP
jgi:hypothetical protein